MVWRDGSASWLAKYRGDEGGAREKKKKGEKQKKKKGEKSERERGREGERKKRRIFFLMREEREV